MTKLEAQGTGADRQKWLDKALGELTKLIEASGEYTVPTNIRVTCGFPHGGKGKGAAVIGQCWGPQASADGHAELFISPQLGISAQKLAIAESVVVVATLAHEIIHAVVGVEAGHKAPFKKLATAIDLTGKMTATTAGDRMKAFAEKIIEKLGTFPMGRLNKATKIGKQTTRLLKCECDGCGYVARVTKKWIIEAGAPICPIEKKPMTCEMPEEGDDD